jgi:phosphoserine phosphatase RsbU/P
VTRAVTTECESAEEAIMKCIDLTDQWRLNQLNTAISAAWASEDQATSRRVLAECWLECYDVEKVLVLDVAGPQSGEYRVVDVLECRARERSVWAPKEVPEVAIRVGGCLETSLASARPVAICGIDCESDAVSLGRIGAGCHSLLAVPMSSGSRAWRTYVFLSRSVAGFTRSNSEQISLMGALLAHQSRLHDLQTRLRCVEDEVRWRADRLASLQRSLMPEHLPRIPGIEIAAYYEPAGTCGGDLYHVVQFPASSGEAAGRVVIMIGDVVGHGPRSAVLMAMVHSILLCYPQIPQSPSAVLEHLNRVLCRLSLPDGSMTMFLGFLSLESRRLRYCRSAHPQPLVRLASGNVVMLEGDGGYPLGMFEDAHCQDSETLLGPGSVLMLYTDGITDTLSPSGTPFNVAGLRQAFSAVAPEPDAVVAEVARAMRAHQGDTPQADDRTLLAVGVNQPRGAMLQRALHEDGGV